MPTSSLLPRALQGLFPNLASLQAHCVSPGRLPASQYPFSPAPSVSSESGLKSCGKGRFLDCPDFPTITNAGYVASAPESQLTHTHLTHQYRLAMLDGGNRHHIAPGYQPCPHSLGIENLTLVHHQHNERLGHPVTPTLRAASFLPAAGAVNRLSLPGAN